MQIKILITDLYYEVWSTYLTQGSKDVSKHKVSSRSQVLLALYDFSENPRNNHYKQYEERQLITVSDSGKKRVNYRVSNIMSQSGRKRFGNIWVLAGQQLVDTPSEWYAGGSGQKITSADDVDATVVKTSRPAPC